MSRPRDFLSRRLRNEGRTNICECRAGVEQSNSGFSFHSLMIRDMFCEPSDRSSMDRSTTQRIAPAGLDVLTVLYDAWNGRIAAWILEHLGAKLFAGLRVAIDERNAFRVVMVASLLTVRTVGFRVDNQSHRANTSMWSVNSTRVFSRELPLRCSAGCRAGCQNRER